MKRFWKYFFYEGILLLSCIVFGTMLMIAVYCIPRDVMWENVKDSVGTLEKEGLYYCVLDTVNSRLDNFTDAFMIGNVITSRGKGIIDDAMCNYRTSVSGMNNIQSLRAYVDHNPTGFWSYGRYWHGYLVFLKPLFTIFNYSQIRWLNMILQSIIIVSVCTLMKKREMTWFCVPLLVTWYLLCPLALMMSLQFSSIFYISFVACLVILLLHEWLDSKYYPYFFMVVGTATSYFDMLTYPTLSLLMPLTLVIVLRSRHKAKVLTPLVTMINYGVSWVVGFLGMWIGKWCMATLLTGADFISQSFSQVLVRISSTTMNGDAIALTTGLQRSANALLTSPVPLVLLLAVGVCVILLAINQKSMDCRIENMYPYILIACVPIMWLLITCNHSSIHFWFTFRNLAASVFALLMGLIAQINQSAYTASDHAISKRIKNTNRAGDR